METKKAVLMTYEEWIEKYKPVLGDNGEPRYFETYGVDVDFVKEQNPLTIWTEEDIDGECAIFSGLHWVNRLGYYITSVSFPENERITVEYPETESDELDEIDMDSPDWTCHYCGEPNSCQPPMADGMRVDCWGCGEEFILRFGRQK